MTPKSNPTDLESIIEQMTAVISSNPDDPDAYFRRGNAHSNLARVPPDQGRHAEGHRARPHKPHRPQQPRSRQPLPRRLRRGRPKHHRRHPPRPRLPRRLPQPRTRPIRDRRPTPRPRRLHPRPGARSFILARLPPPQRSPTTTCSATPNKPTPTSSNPANYPHDSESALGDWLFYRVVTRQAPPEILVAQVSLELYGVRRRPALSHPADIEVNRVLGWVVSSLGVLYFPLER